MPRSPLISQDSSIIRINTAVVPRRRSRLVAALLGMTLGGFGAHRFYLGYPRAAMLQLALTICTLGAGAMWGVAEGWLILLGPFARDAQGAALGHRTGVHVLVASLGSITVHVGTLLGAVWWTHYYGPTLTPPPSGVNSVAIAMSMPTASASPAPQELEVSLEPPEREVDEIEPLPELSTTDVTLEELLQPTRSESSHGLPKAEVIAGPSPAPRLRAAAENSPPRRVEARTETAHRPPKAEAAKPPRVAKAEMPLTPAVGEALQSSAASAASMASQESRGFDTNALPSKVEFPQPVYPPELRRRGITGLVKLRVRVGVEGKVLAASVYRTSGHEQFDQAALDVIRRWRFEPARQAGVPVEMEIAVPIRFVIEKQGNR